MRIAVVSSDKRTIAEHFGRGEYYLVYSTEDENILEREIRPKASRHAHRAGAPDHHHHQHGDDHAGADDRHKQMIEAIEDCRLLIVRGMGARAKAALEEAGITPCSTEIEDAEEAVRAYLGGRKMSEPECGRHMERK